LQQMETYEQQSTADPTTTNVWEQRKHTHLRQTCWHHRLLTYIVTDFNFSRFLECKN
jgi:hypothetical protein